MPTIPLGTNDWMLPSENVPGIRLHNMYIIENPSSPDGLSRVSRPTLSPFSNVGSGPIRGVWRQDGVFGGDAFVVSGSEVFRLNLSTKTSVKLGDVSGLGYPQFAGISGRVLIVKDGTCYSTDGISLTTVSFPDDVPGYEGAAPAIQTVAVINSIFLVGIQNTQRFYWMFPDEDNPDPLSFASAERLPDNLEAIAILQDEVWLIGKSGPEVWSPTADPDLPFQRINGRVYSDGVLSRDSVVQSVFNNLPCLVWITPESKVVLAQGSVKTISNSAVEEAVRYGTDFRAWAFRSFKHDFYVLTSDEQTYVFDLNRGEWLKWDTYLQKNWRAHVGIQSGADAYAGSLDSNEIFELTEGQDDVGTAVVREVSGFVDNPGKPVQCSSVSVRVNAGWSPTYNYRPNLEVRWSDDQGATWSLYDQISMGDKGSYSEDTIFRSLGLITRPGRLFEFRFADKARFRLDYATVNEV